MKKVKLTKPELKKQKDSLKRFQRYLPTLQIKKQLLQLEMGRILRDIKEINGEISRIKDSINPWAGYLVQEIDLSQLLVIDGIETKKVNVTGVDIPMFVAAHIHIEEYDLFEYPLWVDKALEILQALVILTARRIILEAQFRLLSVELQITSQRVNLFEKVKIPEAENAIKKISIHMAEQMATAVGWARIVRKKIQAQERK
ncbi:V-type ATP synthase subunit D [Desulfobacter postgatei]|uniref:V-type ATP synthase subunit D n=1 Tax=Desulfobacter postgatei TaxID=2293 RepID=UPI00259BE490|nr:V-type ATP synthase subunit D [uncultured Desulfobacter sp.]